MGRNWKRTSTWTPWGKADLVEKITRGINFYNTPGHGGFKVSKGLLSKMPKQYVNPDGWYEEDCEWCKVVLAFPEYFEHKVEGAQKTWDVWFKDDGTYKDRSIA
jgi:hypothetical protein